MSKTKAPKSKAQKPRVKTVLPAKPCFGHIGGLLGNLLMEQFMVKGWIAKTNERHYHITKKGEKAFTELGIDLSLIRPEKIS